ncbi:MAG: RICIN domain-containing protein, partial [Myxococcales bacterium]|nr:RICIN domain-containing protein [Myxococcales bacterium]
MPPVGTQSAELDLGNAQTGQAYAARTVERIHSAQRSENSLFGHVTDYNAPVRSPLRRDCIRLQLARLILPSRSSRRSRWCVADSDAGGNESLMDFLVTPLVPYSANAPGTTDADQRIFAIASEHSSLVLALRDELSWTQVAGELTQVSSGADGTVLGIDPSNNVLRWNGAAWSAEPGALKHISVGSAEHIWGVDADDLVYRWTGSAWEQVEGSLRSVAVGSDGTVWGINSDSEVFYRKDDAWEQVSSSLVQIAVGSRTLVWGVDAEGGVFVRRGDYWQQVTGNLSQISIAADGSVWGVDSSNVIWRWSGGGWEQMSGSLAQISVGTGSDVWGVNAAGEIWRNGGAGYGRLVQERWTEDQRQQWRFVLQSDGCYKIQNVGTGKVLDVKKSNQADDADVLGWKWNGTSNQRWSVQDLADGRSRVDVKHSGKTLGVFESGLEAGTAVNQQTWANGSNQRWRISEVKPISAVYDAQATLYEHSNYKGASLQLGVGAYDLADIAALGNDKVSSLRVPEGLRVTLFKDSGFSGDRAVVTGDLSYIGDASNDEASSVLVEKVIRIYKDAAFQGQEIVLGVGKHNVSEIGLANDSLSSLKVPQGMVVALYEHANFGGLSRVYFEDTSYVGDDWNDKVSSIVVAHLGLSIPRDGIRFGGQIKLQSGAAGWMIEPGDGGLYANGSGSDATELFTVERNGPTQHLSHLCWGDTISLLSSSGKYVGAVHGGNASANRAVASTWERWVITRAGATKSNIFVAHGDVIALLSWRGTYMVATDDDDAYAHSSSVTESAM